MLHLCRSHNCVFEAKDERDCPACLIGQAYDRLINGITDLRSCLRFISGATATPTTGSFLKCTNTCKHTPKNAIILNNHQGYCPCTNEVFTRELAPF